MKIINLLLYLMLNLGAGVVNAQEPASSIKVAVGEWPPYVSQHLPYGGLIPHLVQRALKEQGIHVDFEYMPWEQAYKKTLAGEYDATVGWIETEERKKEMHFSQAISHASIVLFHRTESLVSWESLTELAELRVGTVPGYSYGALFDGALKNDVFERLSFESDVDALKGLIKGEIDLFPADHHVGQYLLDELPSESSRQIKFDEHELMNTSLHMLVPLELASDENLSGRSILNKFNQGLQALGRNGQYQEIISNLGLVNSLSRLQFLTEDNAPLNYNTDEGPSGLSVAVVTEILKQLGADEETRKITIYPWARAYSELTKQDNAVVFAMTKTEERAPKFNWVGPIYRSNLILLARKNELKQGTTIDELSEYKICAVGSDVGAQVLESLGHPKNNTYLVSFPRNCALMLSRKRVDLWAFNRDTANWHLTQNGLAPSDFEEVLQLKESSRYIALNKKIGPEIVHALQGKLEYLKLTGELDKIINEELLKANIK